MQTQQHSEKNQQQSYYTDRQKYKSTKSLKTDQYIKYQNEHRS